MFNKKIEIFLIKVKSLTIILIASLFVSSAVAESKLMSKSDFTNEFVKVLQVEIPQMEFKIVSDLHVIAKTADDSLDIFLDNRYAGYISAQTNFETICLDEIKSIKDKEIYFTDKNIDSIMPVLKPKDYIDMVKEQLKQTNKELNTLPFYYEKLNDDIFVLYVFDLPNSMQFVSEEDIKKYHIEKTIRTIAIKNLENYYKTSDVKIEKIDTKKRGDLYVFTADQTYEASLLLANIFLKNQNIPVKGDIVVFLPARDTLFFTGSKDVEGLKTASILATQGYSELAYAISPYGYININGKWERFKH